MLAKRNRTNTDESCQRLHPLVFTACCNWDRSGPIVRLCISVFEFSLPFFSFWKKQFSTIRIALSLDVVPFCNSTLIHLCFFSSSAFSLPPFFSQCAAKEFRFIENLGFFLGVLFGIPLAVASLYYNEIWFMAVGGLVVGYATNWIAVKLIFRPIDPWKLGPLTIQGLFHKRKEEVGWSKNE